MRKYIIIYEDNEILLVKKEAGIAVQGGARVSHSLDKELSRQLGYKVYLVHRLDKETFGLLIVAKSSAAASKWIKLISSKNIKKEYKAICFGLPKINGKESCFGSLIGNVNVKGESVSARTAFNVEYYGNLKDSGCENDVFLSLVHLKLDTGRMHQIRIQLADAMCPIVGDDKYGDFRKNKILKKQGTKNLCLASFRISLPLRSGNKTFEIPLPSYMEDLKNRF